MTADEAASRAAVQEHRAADRERSQAEPYETTLHVGATPGTGLRFQVS